MEQIPYQSHFHTATFCGMLNAYNCLRFSAMLNLYVSQDVPYVVLVVWNMTQEPLWNQMQ